MNLWKTVAFALAIIPATCMAYTAVSFYNNNDQDDVDDRIHWGVVGYACHDIPLKMNNRISYVKPNNTCLVLFYDKSCQGENFVVTRPMSLYNTAHNNKISSFYECEPNNGFCKTPTININADAAPDLKYFGEEVKSILEYWFYLICRLHWSESYKDVDEIEIIFVEKMSGIIGADVWGKKIYALASYFRENQNFESFRKFLHEMAHIVQQYKSGCGWISEGMADQIARDYYQPDNEIPKKPAAGETYFTTQTYFLKYLVLWYVNLMYKINDDCRNGKYREEAFQEIVRKKVEQLWKDMISGVALP